MNKVFLGIIMVVSGLAGLAMTACGIFFLQANGLGLIGIIPGVLLIWGAVAIWKRLGSFSPSGEASQPERKEGP